MDKLNLHTANKVDKNIKAIATLFPGIITERINGENPDGSPIIETAIDFDLLKQELSNVVVEGAEERYSFNWPDKKKSMLLANAPSYKTLRPCREDEKTPTGADSTGKPYCSSGSVNFDTTENLYIEGDNADVLKLLQETYLGKVKMIYIDPPYNTGKDFVYADNFAQSVEDYMDLNENYDEDGNRLFQNSETNGRYHSDWLNMIYPRLRLAKDLLKDDGVIFISIDDNEVHNLRKVCDEVFGAWNFVACFNLQVRYTNKSLNEDNNFQIVMEYVLIYAKNILSFKPLKESIPYDLSKFIYTISENTDGETLKIANKTVTIFREGEWEIAKNDEGRVGLLKETWASGSLVRQSGTAAEFLSKHLIDRKNIDGLGVLYKIHNMGEDGLGYRYVAGPQKEDAIRGKYYSGVPLERLDKNNNISDSRKFLPIPNFYDYSADFGNIRHEGDVSFNGGKKPIKLLIKLIKIANLSNDDIVLDFFSGSATTAHAVMQLNAEDGGNRKFIMVQLPEVIDEKHEAYKAGYRNICEIGKERIRRAGKKINEKIEEENKKIKVGESEKPLVDVGFRVLKVDSTNMEDVYYYPEEVSQIKLGEFIDNIKIDRTPEDLLFQVMLELGVLLSCKIETESINGKNVFVVYQGDIPYLMACFDKDINSEVVTAIAKRKPYYAVFRDHSMENDSLMTSFEQIFDSYSKDTIRRVL